MTKQTHRTIEGGEGGGGRYIAKKAKQVFNLKNNGCISTYSVYQSKHWIWLS